MSTQASLFDLPPPTPSHLPPGLLYEPEFLARDEEAALIERIRALPLEAARYKSYTARRRVASYGGRFDYEANRLVPSPELVPALHPLRDRVALWFARRLAQAGEGPPSPLVHVLVAEYAPGTPLGWHRDVPDFEHVIGVSLGSDAWLRFRPYPPVQPKRSDIVRLPVQARSIYMLRGPARWKWQHGVAPTESMRWSITFRTARRNDARRSDRHP